MTSPLAPRVPAPWWALALACPVAAALATWHFAVDVPFWDQWDWLYRLYGGGGAFDLARYWPLMNEHRVVVPLVFDWLLFDQVGIDMRIRALLKVPISLTTLGSLVVLLRHTAPRANLAYAAVVFSALLFSAAYWPTWADPRNYAAHLAQAFTVAAVTMAATRVRGWRTWWAAAACSVAAAWSTTVGALAWPVVLAVLWWRGFRPVALFGWVLAASVVIAPHAVDVIAAGPALATQGPDGWGWAMVKFALAFYGRPMAPVAESLRYWPSLAAGTCGMLLCAVLLGRRVGRRDSLRDDPAFPWCVLAAWGLAIGLLVTIGRGSGEVAAVHDARFVVAATPFWISLAALAMVGVRAGPAPASRTGVAFRRAVWGLLVAGYLSAGADAVFSGGPARLSLRLATGRHCMVDLTTAPDACLQLLHPVPDVVRRLAPVVTQRPSKLGSPAGAPTLLRGSWGDTLTFDVRDEPAALPLAHARVLVRRLGDVDRVPSRQDEDVVFPVISQATPAALTWRLRLPSSRDLHLVTAVRGGQASMMDRWRVADVVAYVEIVPPDGPRLRAWSSHIDPGAGIFAPVNVDLSGVAGEEVGITIGVEYAKPGISRFMPRPIVEWVHPDITVAPPPPRARPTHVEPVAGPAGDTPARQRG